MKNHLITVATTVVAIVIAALVVEYLNKKRAAKSVVSVSPKAQPAIKPAETMAAA